MSAPVYTAWPTEVYLKTFVVDAGLVATAPSNMQVYLDQAVEEFESRTGYRPFLAEDSETVLYFSPPFDGSRVLDMQTAFYTVTEVVTGLALDGTGGSTLTANQAYVLLPYGEGPVAPPYRYIDFLYGVSGGHRSIKVTGRRGFQTPIDADIWQAVVQKAALNALPFMSQSQGDAVEIQQGSVRIRYGEQSSETTSLATRVGNWTNAFETAIQKVIRI